MQSDVPTYCADTQSLVVARPQLHASVQPHHSPHLRQIQQHITSTQTNQAIYN